MPTEIVTERDLLARIVSPERPTIPLKSLVIVAHPDDETLGCGALLRRLAGVTVLHVTDGAPRNARETQKAGFTHWADYARVRRRELECAAHIAGLEPPALKSLGLPDHGAALRLAQLTRAMLGFIAGADLVITHAYEGLHPDHDAVAFAVAAARSHMRGKAPILLEMPLGENALHRGMAGQDGHAHGSVRLTLNAEERARKARMLAAFETQHDALAPLGVCDEFYRVAPAYDFTQPPSGGLDDGEERDLAGGRFAELARAARNELGLARLPP